MLHSAFATDLLAPFEGRLARTVEICAACMLVVIVSMMFQIPEPALSAYLIFFVAKENSGLNMLMSLVFIIVVTLVVAMSFGLALATVNAPEARILVLAAVSFIAFFLGASSKLAPLAGTIGLIVAYVLDLLGSTPFGEIATRGLLYAWLFVAMPMLVFLIYNIFFGRHPETLARRKIAERLLLAVGVLRDKDEQSLERLREDLQSGGVELAKSLKMIHLWRRQPANTIKRLGELASQSYAMAMTVSAWAAVNREAAIPETLIDRLELLAKKIERLPRVIRKSGNSADDPAAPRDLSEQITGMVASMENIVAGGALAPTETAPEKPKSGFFVADAFTNPAYSRFAAKGTAAVMICYLTFTLLDWPGIHTSMLTCFIVALGTVGETIQKLSLRIAGCLAGAMLGTLSIVFLLPQTTSIDALVILIGLVTFPAAWIAVGKPTVSYIGFQMAFALYLCILQGTEPKFDLTIARDRTIGILFGNVVVYLIFTRVFPVSTLTHLRLELDRLIQHCRKILTTKSASISPAAAIKEAGAAYASIETIAGNLAAYSFEALRSKNGHVLARANRQSIATLKNFVDAIGVVAALPPPVADTKAEETLRPMLLQAEAQLQALSSDLSSPPASPPAQREPSHEPAESPQISAIEALMARMNNVQLALFRYRQLLQTGTGAYE